MFDNGCGTDAMQSVICYCAWEHWTQRVLKTGHNMCSIKHVYTEMTLDHYLYAVFFTTSLSGIDHLQKVTTLDSQHTSYCVLLMSTGKLSYDMNCT